MPSLKQRLMLRFVNIWPPFAAAGIHVRWSADMKSADVEMNLRPWNRNFVGTHYGGSLYSMTDPFYMLMLISNLGPEYVVWDKAAHIRWPRIVSMIESAALMPTIMRTNRNSIRTAPV